MNLENMTAIACETCQAFLGLSQAPRDQADGDVAVGVFRKEHAGHAIRAQHVLGGLWFDVQCGLVKGHAGGCQDIRSCGLPLQLFENGNPDWVIAYDARDAAILFEEATGCSAEDYGGDEEWSALPDDHLCRFWIDRAGEIADDAGESTQMSAAEAVARFGRRDPKTELPFYASSDC